MSDRTSLSYWFPILVQAGIPVPRTIAVHMPMSVQRFVFETISGECPEQTDEAEEFLGRLKAAGAKLGFPCFLRTDHTSGKHNWKNSCYWADPDQVGRHVCAIAEYSELAGFPGLPWSRWVVRELLPVKQAGLCPNYGDMPLVRELRYFSKAGKIVCRHPYWPEEALEQGGAPRELHKELTSFSDLSKADAIAESAAKAIGGDWSIDLLETERGWFVIDMAEADKSYHWPDCEMAPAKGDPQ